MKRRSARLFAGVCLLSLAGCYQKVAENEALVFSFQLWVPLLVAIVGLAAVPIGVVLFARKHPFWGICLIVGGPLVAAGLAPGMYLDRVIVDKDGFYSRHGFWWSPTIHQVRYQDLNYVQVGFEEHHGRRGKTYSYYFDCHFKAGKKERVPLGDIMREALPEIAEQFRKHGVPVQIPDNLPN